MISMKATTSIKSAKKYLKDVQKKDIPTTRKMATVSAARACKKPINDALVARLHVQKKYVSRRTWVSKYDKKTEGVTLTFYSAFLNAAGPKKKPAPIKVPGLTATGRKKKNHGKVVAMGRVYSSAWAFHGSHNAIILQRNKGSKRYPIHVAKIPVGKWAEKMKVRKAEAVFPPKFKKEYERILKAKVKKRAAR